MADDSDDSQKTEEPSQRKLEKAREEGQVVSSKEVSSWIVLFTGAVLAAYVFPQMGRGLVEALAPFISNTDDFHVDDLHTVSTVVVHIALKVLLLIGVIGIVMALVSMAGNVVQHGFLWSAASLAPKLSKISPLAGLKRLFSRKSVVEFLKGIAKLTIVAGVAFFMIRPAVDGMDQWTSLTMRGILDVLQALIAKTSTGVLAVLFLIAALDYLFQRFDFINKMRMSRHELKEEYKESEGDPHIKAKLKQQRRQMAKKQNLSKVPEATVVVTNPTHYAVALKYQRGQAGAPIVLAKGVDFLAAKIREVANKHQIPIVENPPLARALYAACDVDEEIPFQHYKAVAEVIRYVFRLKQRLNRRSPR
ncbi:MAG: flagellar biosynthesis protein FlhB [Holosporales bacterium]|jgi:flagellar biosynthetic protein FlhB